MNSMFKLGLALGVPVGVVLYFAFFLGVIPNWGIFP
jgi:hypothetical protein